MLPMFPSPSPINATVAASLQCLLLINGNLKHSSINYNTVLQCLPSSLCDNESLAPDIF